jgi:dihydroorotate dehydrogenase (fumarate)
VDVHGLQPHLASNDGYAGLSGPAIKYTALANVRKLRQLVVPEIDIVGVGGIQSGADVMEFLLAGAVACQMATCHWKEGAGAFDRVLQELRELMQDMGLATVSEITSPQQRRRLVLSSWTNEGAQISRLYHASKSDKKKKGGSATPNAIIIQSASNDTNMYTMCHFGGLGCDSLVG